jgi:F-type H+-transporting ATPase subunit b
MTFSSEFFETLGFVIFVCLLGYFGLHRKIADALDQRTQRIQKELAEARRLREEAEAVLASFKKKAVEAEAEAAAIIAQAKAEAEALAEETAARMADFIERRTKQALTKIALAEAQATADVRAAAAEAAAKAAEIVLKSKIKGAAAADLVTKGIDDLTRLMH